MKRKKIKRDENRVKQRNKIFTKKEMIQLSWDKQKSVNQLSWDRESSYKCNLSFFFTYLRISPDLLTKWLGSDQIFKKTQLNSFAPDMGQAESSLKIIEPNQECAWIGPT